MKTKILSKKCIMLLILVIFTAIPALADNYVLDDLTSELMISTPGDYTLSGTTNYSLYIADDGVNYDNAIYNITLDHIKIHSTANPAINISNSGSQYMTVNFILKGSNYAISFNNNGLLIAGLNLNVYFTADNPTFAEAALISFTSDNDFPAIKKTGNCYITVDHSFKTAALLGSQYLPVDEAIAGATADRPLMFGFQPKSSNLSSLTLTGISLTPAFDPDVTDYTAHVDFNVNNTTLTAIAEDQQAKVNDQDGQHTKEFSTLAVGNTVYTISVVNNDITKTYTVNIHKDSPALLSNMSADPGVLVPTFSPEIYSYNVNVATDISSLNIVATAATPGATIEGTGVKNINIGDTILKIEVTGVDPAYKKTYTINAHRISNISTLSGLSIDPLTLDPPFSQSTQVYRIGVGYDVNSLNIVATAKDPYATVAGDGQKTLNVGSNQFNIVVTAENTTTNTTYTLNVYRRSNDATLSNLTVNPGTLTPVFDPAQNSYTVTVGYDNPSITIGATANHASAQVTGAIGTKDIAVGDNQFEIFVTAEDVNYTETYTVNVHRKSNDAVLSSLTVNQGTLTPAFDPAVNTYNVTVDYDIPSITIGATANHASAQITGAIGAKDLVVGDNQFEILVTAEDVTYTKTYTVNVHRKSNDATLSSLTVNPGTLTPAFDPAVNTYNVTVGYDIPSITIGATANHASAQITGAIGAKDLVVGDNQFEILVTAEDATYTKTYTVNVHRKSNDATLSSLTVNPATLSPEFNSDTYIYNITVGYDISSINIEATANHQLAIIAGEIGTQNLIVGDNQFEIFVTAEDLNYTKTYTVNVHRKSNDATLSNLTVDPATLSPEFNSDTYIYNITVGYDISSINIEATANHQLAIIAGEIGTQNLIVGDNQFEIFVTAEDLNYTKTYTVNVHRKSNDATLSSLTVNPGDLTPEFNPDIITYEIIVHSSIESFTITGVANHPLAGVEGNVLNAPLVMGNNPFPIIVTAEDSNYTKTYTVNVYRLSNDATLSAINVSESALNETFDPQRFTYSVNVPHEINTIAVTGITNHPNATIVGNEMNKMLVVGTNVVLLDVTAEDGTTELQYKVKIFRAKSPDATLSALTVSAGTLSPNFNPQTDSYEVSVSHETTKINITGTANHPEAIVTGNVENGIIVPGDNQFMLVVIAADGVNTKNYYVTVHRAYSDDATLASLTIDHGSLTPSFDPQIIEYRVDVNNSTETITIEGTATHPNATVTGNGTKHLNVRSNIFWIKVTSESGNVQKSYRVVVYRKESSNANLASLTVSEGRLEPNFSPSVTNYTVDLPNEIESISVTGVAAHEHGTVKGNVVDLPLEIGVNTVTILVTAEDRVSTKSYIVEINRAAPPLVYYTITSSVFNNVGGTISPEGTNEYLEGTDVTFTMTPNKDYFIEELIVDGVGVTVSETYTFNNISKDHTILVKYTPITGIVKYITQIKVYPNPTTDYAIIESTNDINRIAIFNSSANILFERKDINQKSFRIETNNFPKGIYYINIDGKTEKLIVE